jgi:hypothetical protein
MLIKKKANSFNDYVCEFSWTQLEAIKNALAHDHADVVSDELYAGISWFFSNLPGPGESEEDIKKAEEAEDSGLASPEAEGGPLKRSADDLLPMPGEGEEGPEREEEPERGEAEGPPEEPEESEADRRLPPPPEE